jgi:hypothetical protein
METMIVYVDDVEYARTMLSPLVPAAATNKPSKETNWVMVACAPHMPNDAGKWASPQAMQLWRADWANEAIDQLKPLLSSTGGTVSTKLADHKTSLVEQTNALLELHSDAKVFDARRPKFGQDMEPVTTAQPQGKKKLAGLAAAVTVATVLAADF